MVSRMALGFLCGGAIRGAEDSPLCSLLGWWPRETRGKGPAGSRTQAWLQKGVGGCSHTLTNREP